MPLFQLKIRRHIRRFYIFITSFKIDPSKHYRRKKHHARRLQNIVNKYGINGVKFEILQVCDPSECINLEQIFIDELRPALNTVRIAGSTIGYKHTPESLALMSLQRKGRKLSESHIRIISESKMGKKPSNFSTLQSPEVKKKRADSIRGIKRPYIKEMFSKKVYQYTRIGDFVAEFNSFGDAAQSIGKDRSMISKCVAGVKKTIGGYRWSLSRLENLDQEKVTI